MQKILKEISWQGLIAEDPSQRMRLQILPTLLARGIVLTIHIEDIMNFDYKRIFGEHSGCKKTNVTFRIIGDDLNPDEITKSLDIQPTRSYYKGENYKIPNVGIRQRPIGHWSVNSDKIIQSTSTEKHAKCLLNILEQKSERVLKFVSKSHLRISIVFWWEGIACHGGFSLSNETLGRLCRFCNDIDYHFIGG